MANRFAWLTMLTLLTVWIAGCGTTGGSSDAGDAEGAAVVEDRGGATTAGLDTSGGSWSGSPLENPDSPLYTKVIYFDFDQSTIRPDFIDILRAHANHLITTGDQVTIEGHADERGSREYNIALGERRAIAVKNFLEAEGVAPGQITTVSYGEERPADLGFGESAWAANRRAELVY